MKDASDFREILKFHYGLRRSRRPSYSQRAFARDLGLHPAALADILKGRHGISATVANRIADVLELSGDDKSVFIDLVESQHARSRTDREAAMARLQARRALTPWSRVPIEGVTLISKWYYPAVLEYLGIESRFEFRSKIAEGLNLTLDQVEEAVGVLLQLGLVEISEGQIRRVENYALAESDLPSEVIQNFHRSMMSKAVTAMKSQPLKRRKFMSLMLPFNSSRYDEVMHFFSEMEEEFFKRFEEKRAVDSIYCLGLQFVRMDRDVPSEPS